MVRRLAPARSAAKNLFFMGYLSFGMSSRTNKKRPSSEFLPRTGDKIILRCHLASRRAARTHRNANTLLLRNGEFRCTILGPKTVPVHPLRSICPMRCCRASTAPGSLQTRLPVLLPLLRFVMGLLYHALQHVTRLYFYEFLLYHRSSVCTVFIIRRASISYPIKKEGIDP